MLNVYCPSPSAPSAPSCSTSSAFHPCPSVSSVVFHPPQRLLRRIQVLVNALHPRLAPIQVATRLCAQQPPPRLLQRVRPRRAPPTRRTRNSKLGTRNFHFRRMQLRAELVNA